MLDHLVHLQFEECLGSKKAIENRSTKFSANDSLFGVFLVLENKTLQNIQLVKKLQRSSAGAKKYHALQQLNSKILVLY